VTCCWRCVLGLAAALCLLPGASAGLTVPAKGTVEVAFSPKHDPQALLVEVIEQASERIYVHAYIFTSRTLAAALVDAHERGVRVEVLADADMHRRGEGNMMPTFLAAGIPVAFETAYAAAHNKALIIDPGESSCTLVTGSYNFTWSAANRNAENILVFRDNCALVDVYYQNWQRHREDASRVDSLPWRR